MADELNREESDQETQEPKAQIEDTTHQSDAEDAGRKSAIARIADIFRGRSSGNDVEDDEADEVTEPTESDEPTDAEETENTEDAGDDVATDEYEEIDPKFVDAARSYGWSDDRIVQYAEDHDDHDLVLLTGMMKGQAKDVNPDDVVPKPKEDESPYAKVLQELEGNEAVGDLTKQLLKSLVSDFQTTKAQLQTLTTAQKDAESGREHDVWIGRLQEADSVFDESAKEFPEFGAAKTLRRLPDGSLNPNDDAVQVRESLFKVAVALFNSGSSWSSAVKDAMRWYRGGRDDVVEAKVLNKIKANSRRVTPKREARKVTKKYDNPIQEKAAVVNEALRKHGVELPE